jgi:hypothetical protein
LNEPLLTPEKQKTVVESALDLFLCWYEIKRQAQAGDDPLLPEA